MNAGGAHGARAWILITLEPETGHVTRKITHSLPALRLCPRGNELIRDGAGLPANGASHPPAQGPGINPTITWHSAGPRVLVPPTLNLWLTCDRRLQDRNDAKLSKTSMWVSSKTLWRREVASKANISFIIEFYYFFSFPPHLELFPVRN